MRPRLIIGYCPEDGLFYFNGRVICAFRNRYRFVHFQGTHYRAHQLAWFLMTGEWPSREIDHINRDKCDNRWYNLREASPSQNRANAGIRSSNTSGIRNVRFYPRYGKWHAQIAAYGKKYHLGYFTNKEDAINVCIEKRLELFGEFANPIAAYEGSHD